MWCNDMWANRACTELANINALKSSSTLSYRQSGDAGDGSALSSRQIGDAPSWEISINFRVVVHSDNLVLLFYAPS